MENTNATNLLTTSNIPTANNTLGASRNENAADQSASLDAIENELQTIRQEVADLRTMAEKLSTQEAKNSGQLQNMSNKTPDLNQMAVSEQQATMLLQQMRELCEHMNLHIDHISSGIGGNIAFQNQFHAYTPQAPMTNSPQAPMINGGLPLTEAFDRNLNESRPDPNYVQYPYNRFTT